MTNVRLQQAVEAYFTDLRLIRSSGGATDERSLYVPLANLLNTVGGALRPKVFCVQDLARPGRRSPRLRPVHHPAGAEGRSRSRGRSRSEGSSR